MSELFLEQLRLWILLLNNLKFMLYTQIWLKNLALMTSRKPDTI